MTIAWDAAGLATLGWWLIGLSAVCWLRVWFKPNADAWPYWASAGCVLLVCALCAAAGWGLVRSSGGVVDLSGAAALLGRWAGVLAARPWTFATLLVMATLAALATGSALSHGWRGKTSWRTLALVALALAAFIIAGEIARAEGSAAFPPVGN